jgi:hypothetical protein
MIHKIVRRKKDGVIFGYSEKLAARDDFEVDEIDLETGKSEYSRKEEEPGGKAELIDYAERTFGVKLDKRMTIDNLRLRIEALKESE